MSDKPTNDPAASQTALQTTPRVSPSTTAFAELANTLIAAITRVSAAVPVFDDSRVSRDFVERKLRVPAPFVIEAVAALIAESELRGVNALNSDRILLRQQYIDAFYPLLRHMEVAAKELRFRIEAQEALLASDAQQIYGVGKALAQDRSTNSMLKVYVRNMSRALRAARRPRRKGAGTGEPESDATSGE